jgi:hypothetical protein
MGRPWCTGRSMNERPFRRILESMAQSAGYTECEGVHLSGAAQLEEDAPGSSPKLSRLS